MTDAKESASLLQTQQNLTALVPLPKIGNNLTALVPLSILTERTPWSVNIYTSLLHPTPMNLVTPKNMD